MAPFNPTAGRTGDTGIPNQLGSSQGTGPNKTFDTLFSGLTQTAINSETIKDVNTQNDIRRDAEQAFDATNQEFGLNPPAPIGGGDAVPTGMQSDLDSMATLKAAVDQGKISQVNYYGRLATLSKQLRSKYPGYEEIVDRTIQSVTGTRPANAYRDAIFSELNQMQQDASSEEKFQRQFNKENAGILSAVYGDEYFQNPGAYDFNKVQADVAKFKGRATLIESETQQLGLLAKRGEFNDKRAEKAIDQDFSFIVESSLNKATGANQPSASAKIDQFIQAGGGSPQELNQFITNITSMEGELRAQLIARGREKYVASGIMKQSDVNAAVDAAMYPLTKAKEAVLGGDFKLAARYATLNKAMTDQQVSEMMQDPTFRAGAGLSEVSKTLGDAFLGANQDQIQNLALEVAGQTILGRQNIVKNTVESGNQKLARTMIDKSFEAILDPKLSGEKFSNVIDQYFGKDAIDFMSSKVVDSGDLESVYTKFLNPNMTAAIVSKGTPEDLQKYTAWALDKVAAIPAFKKAAGDVNNVAFLDSLTVQYDEKTNKVKFLLPDGSTPNGIVDNAFYGRTLNAFNKVMTVMTPIMEANGVHGEDAAKTVLKALGVREGSNDSPNIFSRIWSALPSDLTKTTGEALGRQGKELLAEVPESDGGALDFLYEAGKGASDALGALADTDTAKALLKPIGDLKISNARGYTPDVGNLRPDVAKGVSELQNAWGRDLPIVSGYRDPERNARAGGAKKSQHMHGKAVDIDVRNLSIPERQELIKLARQHGFKGIGVYANSLHLDKGTTRSWGPNYHHTSLPAWAREVL